jgi:hypothetical protein
MADFNEFTGGTFQPGGTGEAAARGFASGATLGLAPYIGAFAHKMMGGQTYAQGLAQERADNEQAMQTHPIVSIGSDVAGSVLGVGGLAKGLTKIPAIARWAAGSTAGQKAVALGGTAGAIQGAAGSTELKELPGNVVLGAGLGAAVPYGLSKAGDVLDAVIAQPSSKAVAESLRKIANSDSPSDKAVIVSIFGDRNGSALTHPDIYQSKVDMLKRAEMYPENYDPASVRSNTADIKIADQAFKARALRRADIVEGLGPNAIPMAPWMSEVASPASNLGSSLKTLGAAAGGGAVLGTAWNLASDSKHPWYVDAALGAGGAVGGAGGLAKAGREAVSDIGRGVMGYAAAARWVRRSGATTGALGSVGAGLATKANEVGKAPWTVETPAPDPYDVETPAPDPYQ